jgi:uncharacterized membrane protein YozB (DUF420 family)
MDPKLVFWTGALVNMSAIVCLAALGVRERRRGAIAAHRRRMLAAGSLVALFLAAYAVKLALLGREDRSAWDATSVWVLRIHELCVLTMVVAGGLAAARGRRLARTRHATGNPVDPVAPPALGRGHRRAGWVAVVAAALGFATAAVVLAGMYRRAGLF